MSTPSHDLLRKNFLFAQLTGDELDQLAEVLRHEEYEPGQSIVREGEAGDSLYLVAAGGVNVVKGSDQHFLSYLGGGGYFGEMALFMPGALRTASCVAALKTTCWVIDKATLDRFCTEHPVPGNKIYREIIRALAERLAATSSDLAMLMKSQVMDQQKISELVAKK